MAHTYTVTLCNGCGEVDVQGAPVIGHDRQGVSTGRLDFFGTVETFTSGEGLDGRLSAGIVFQTPDVLVASFAPGCWTHFVLNEEAPSVMDEINKVVAKMPDTVSLQETLFAAFNAWADKHGH